MRYHNEYPKLGPTFITIGVFDGVHLGHQQLLKTLVHHAHAMGFKAVVFTFSEHPSHLFDLGHLKPAITTLEHRLHLIESCGVDDILIFDFTKEFAAQTAEQFLKRLKQSIDVKGLFLGYDGKIGSDRKKSNFTDTELITIPPYSENGHLISSSKIRDEISHGDFKNLPKMLGRPYTLYAPVISGEGRGKKLSIPTLNIDVKGLQLPPKGVYELRYLKDSVSYKAIGNLGHAPTFGKRKLLLEVHLLEVPDSIDEMAEVEFVRFIRPEKKFNSKEALIEQIKQDIKQVS
ncbi:MAG: riboflavin biosynthesis protein RibF [Parachlamydiaceae bacterium]